MLCGAQMPEAPLAMMAHMLHHLLRGDAKMADKAVRNFTKEFESLMEEALDTEEKKDLQTLGENIEDFMDDVFWPYVEGEEGDEEEGE
jgi:hypothetical protein